MARIRGRDTGPERELRTRLWQEGLRYRLHRSIGRICPDLVFLGARVVVFVDGCFWHGCPDHYVPPRSSRPFWSRKLEENVRRDSRQTRELEEAGWAVVRIWEHEVRRDVGRVAQEVRAVVVDGQKRRGKARRVLRVDFPDGRGDREVRHLVDLRTLAPAGVVRRHRVTNKL